ncbi:MAG TPA: TolC family protein [Calditrichia bacterium]|nr:TolC family protein [Calditrichota bacterium]HQU73575.1 TolC family protein [Calditrichia bacterium]HQV32635.1 TolC family protein [Calditrichia bacterium]
MFRFCFAVILAGLACLPARGQSPVLEGYIRMGVENNLTLIQENLAVQKARAEKSKAAGLFLPDVSFQANYTWADGGRTIGFPIGDLLNPVYQALNFPIRLENEEIQLLPDEYQETKLQIIQPLFNTDIYYNYRAQRDLSDVQEAQRQAYLNELTKEIRSGYYQYLQTLAVMDIYGETRLVLEEFKRVNQRLFEVNKVTRDAVSSADYELSQLDQEIAGAEKNRRTAAAYFNFLLNRSLDSPIEVEEPTLSAEYRTELENARREALRQRPELTQLMSAGKAAHHFTNLNKASFLPKAFVAAEAGYQGYHYKFDDTQDYWLARVGLEWNLFNGGRTVAGLQQARIEEKRLSTRREELEQQIQLQVINAYYTLEAAQKSLEAARKGEIAAQERFRIVQRKYQEGQAAQIEFLDARSKFTTARLSRAIARYTWLIRQAELQRAIGN